MAKRKSAAKKATRKSTPARRSAAARKTAGSAKGRGGAKAARKAAKKVVARKAAKKVTAKKAVKKVAARKASKAVKRPVSKLAKKTATKAAPKVAAKAPVKATAKAPAPVAKKAAPKAAPKDKPVGTDRASIPSSLVLDQHSSSAQSGRQAQRDQLKTHTETSPDITGGDVDADWETAYSSGDEAPGGDNPTPDQDRVDDIGKALGVEYEDNEELKGADKITDRDKHRWELNPASSDDYRERK